ncbi:MAG: hypothetical protein OQL09_03280 [Gammaproteobacteria bacterium]|nr:hypothetical protein [Gammaproteobacteria bacterium]
MTLDTIIDTHINIVIHTAYGKFGPGDVKHILDGLISNPDFKQDMNVVWDFREVTDINFSAEELKQIVGYTEAHLAYRKPDYKLALVASDDLIFGLARMFMAYSEHLPIKITTLRTLKEAMAWVQEY